MSTERLHIDDSLHLQFEARVSEVTSFRQQPSVVLDRSAFYPESGGQMADHGALHPVDQHGVDQHRGAPHRGDPHRADPHRSDASLTVSDVQIDAEGRVHHIVDDRADLEVGAAVRGEVDRVRRREHMALHTGQHVLSRALLEETGGQTVSSRLGDNSCTIDIDRIADEAALAAAEALGNAVVDDDLSVRGYFPDNLDQLKLRRPPKIDGAVRVVEIGEFDVVPCGGTHCLHTAQIGLLRIFSVERHRGGLRIHFSAGARARARLASESQTLRDLSNAFSCAPNDVPTAIDNLRRQLAAARGDSQALQADLAERIAQLDHADVLCLEGAPVALLRDVAQRLCERQPRERAPGAEASVDGAVFLATRRDDGLHVVVARGAASAFHCGNFMREAAKQSGGRGGGRAERAEGRLPRDTDWNTLVDSVRRAP